MSRVRLFVAVPVGDDVRERIAAALADLGQIAPGARRSPPENLHLTLRFLGATDEALVPALTAALEEQLAGAAAFDLEVAGAGAFGPPRRPRVLYLDVRGDPAPLADLAARVDRAVDGLSLPPRDRPFTAHLTLARARDRGGDPRLERALVTLSDRSFGPLRVSEVVLYQSELGPGGSRYLARARISLPP